MNAVAPGFIETAMVEKMPQQVIAQVQSQISLRTLGQAEDVANTYVFLASDEVKYITGHTLHIDGGIMMYGQDKFKCVRIVGTFRTHFFTF